VKDSPPFVLWLSLTGAVIGLALVAGGVYALSSPGASNVFAVCTLLTGCAELALARGVLKRSRLAWAYLSALSGVLGLAFVFAIPTLSGVLSTNYYVAAIPAVVLVGATALCILSRESF